jgi:hypothetical protein
MRPEQLFLFETPLLKRCGKCGIPKSLDAFGRSSGRDRYGRGSYCRPCSNMVRRDWYLSQTDAACGRCGELNRTGAGKCRTCNKRYFMMRHREHREEERFRQFRFHQSLRRLVIGHYGGKCACCDEERLEFLAIDHIKGGGNKHRKTNDVQNIYAWIKRNNFPTGFRVLCHNCNMSLGFYGYCAHRVSDLPPRPTVTCGLRSPSATVVWTASDPRSCTSASRVCLADYMWVRW